MTAGQLQAAVLRAGSKCTQSLCSALGVACRFPSCYQWTPGLPLSIPFNSSHAFCVCFTACKQWEQGGQWCKGGEMGWWHREMRAAVALPDLLRFMPLFYFITSAFEHRLTALLNPLITSKTFCCYIPDPHTLSSCP